MTTTHNRWIGGATAVAQVQTIRFTTSEAGNTVTITLTAEDGSTQAVTHTVADTNNNTTAAAVQSALCHASSLSLFTRLTYTVSTDTVTITADLAGRPFKLAVSDNGNHRIYGRNHHCKCWPKRFWHGCQLEPWLSARRRGHCLLHRRLERCSLWLDPRPNTATRSVYCWAGLQRQHRNSDCSTKN